MNKKEKQTKKEKKKTIFKDNKKHIAKHKETVKHLMLERTEKYKPISSHPSSTSH